MATLLDELAEDITATRFMGVDLTLDRGRLGAEGSGFGVEGLGSRV